MNNTRFPGIDVNVIPQNTGQYPDEEMDTTIHIRDIPGMRNLENKNNHINKNIN